ncbi:MAG TPA: right-handed parallel beta-helix repeat-containing protein [Thermoanaerobaculia bacterium]|nr:right-handed parallel beta-helix repeat-containing protein [Thermoanaerobaculia bacterium]
MPRFLRIAPLITLLLLMFGGVVYADDADLRATLQTNAVPKAGLGLTFSLTVENVGPDAASDVVAEINIATLRTISFDPRVCTWAPPVLRCSAPRIEAGASTKFSAGVYIPSQTLTITASVTSSTNDPEPFNNDAVLALVPEFPARLAAAITVSPPPMSGRSTDVLVRVTNEGTETASDIHATLTFDGDVTVGNSPNFPCHASGPRTVDCSLGGIGARDGITLDLAVTLGAAGTTLRATATLSASNTERPVTASYEATIAAVADLRVTVEMPSSLNAEGNIAYRFTIVNANAFGAPRVQGHFVFSQGSHFVAAHDADCRETDVTRETTVVCTINDIGPNESRQLTLYVRPPQPQGHFSAFGEITWDDPIFGVSAQTFVSPTIYRDYAVTTTGDNITGSLRQAIQNANAECAAPGTPCRIVFHLPAPVPRAGWFTIVPASPLPALTMPEGVVDGTTQTAFTGDTNPAGPEIEIRGSAASDNGFVIHGQRTIISGLSIDGFAENGILVERNDLGYPAVTISGNVVGLDPSGELSVPNKRGIFFQGGSGTVADNVIRGNIRSAIFLAEGSGIFVLRNVISGNGASGVYVGPTTSVSIEKNEIANNGEFGIAISYARHCSTIENSIHDNGIDAIDIGLDGPSANGPLLSRTPRPTITSARYDAATGETVIAIDAKGPEFASVIAHVYANHSLNGRGFAEAERYLGNVRGGEFRIAEDLRGQIITALSEIVISVNDTYSVETSELSEGVIVR